MYTWRNYISACYRKGSIFGREWLLNFQRKVLWFGDPTKEISLIEPGTLNLLSLFEHVDPGFLTDLLPDIDDEKSTKVQSYDIRGYAAAKNHM